MLSNTPQTPSKKKKTLLKLKHICHIWTTLVTNAVHLKTSVCRSSSKGT